MSGEDLDITCPASHVIVTSSARFGRMEITKCIEVEEFIGCENNVLFLLDDWCSGRQQCQVKFPNPELKAANHACLRYLQMYLELQYHCLKGTSMHYKCIYWGHILKYIAYDCVKGRRGELISHQ